MIHDQLNQIFCYLGLDGYSDIHAEQYEDESRNYRTLSKYYISKYGRFLPLAKVGNPELISDSWLKMPAKDIRSTTRQQIIESCFSKWITWEEDTLGLYHKLYSELIGLGEVSSAAKLLDYIVDVDKELISARKIAEKLQTIDYDMVAIYDEQSSVYKDFLAN